MFNTIKSMYQTIIRQDVSKPEAERDVRLAMNTLILLFGMTVMILYIPMIYVLGVDLSIRYVLAFFGICFAHVLIWKRKTMIWVDIFAVIFAINIAIIVSYGTASESKYIWAIMYIVYVYIFADIRQGIIYPLLLLGLIVITQTYARLNHESSITVYDLKFLLRFTYIYLVLSFVLLISIWIRVLNRLKLDIYSKDSAATIIELEKIKEELKVMGDIDHLTSLYNRRYLDNNGQDFLMSGKSKFVMSIFIDIDFFKEYNDYYGHMEGDKVLKDVADKVGSILILKNSIVVRYGGEELLSLVKFDKKQDIEKIAGDIVEGVGSLQIIHGKSEFERITCSVGVAYKNRNEYISIDKLIEKSDEAMYRAKNCGRNQYFIINDIHS